MTADGDLPHLSELEVDPDIANLEASRAALTDSRISWLRRWWADDFMSDEGIVDEYLMAISEVVLNIGGDYHPTAADMQGFIDNEQTQRLEPIMEKFVKPVTDRRQVGRYASSLALLFAGYYAAKRTGINTLFYPISSSLGFAYIGEAVADVYLEDAEVGFVTEDDEPDTDVEVVVQDQIDEEDDEIATEIRRLVVMRRRFIAGAVAGQLIMISAMNHLNS